MRGTCNIGVILPHQLAYARGIIRGITRYAVPAQPWILFPLEVMNPTAQEIARLRHHDLVGAIVYLSSRELLASARKLGVPMVNVASILDEPGVPHVGVDDIEVGRMAAAHFLERGYRNFAFFGNLASEFTRRRLQGFREIIERREFTVHTPPSDTPPPWQWSPHEKPIRRWLHELPKPVAIFGYTDLTARLFATICRDAGVHIPEEVALVGVDNDALVCEMSFPPLSSVEQPLEQIGYKAAEMLSAMIAGRKPPPGSTLLPPVGVVTRQSSDIVAIHDPEVAAAMQYIRENADQPIRVEDILDQVPINRRSLEKRFRMTVGQSILKEINRTHVERAKRLLLNTRMPVSEVAERAGFNSATRFGIVFAKLAGMTPNQFRKTFSAE